MKNERQRRRKKIERGIQGLRENYSAAFEEWLLVRHDHEDTEQKADFREPCLYESDQNGQLVLIAK